MDAVYFKPKWVSVSDFKNFWGKDLRFLLSSSSDNNSNYPEVFLARIEDHVCNWIDNNTFRIVDFYTLRGGRLAAFQKAILTQAMYILRSGELGLDSGYDPERGQIVDFDKLNRIAMSNDAFNYLQNAGLINLTMKNRPRFMHGNYEVASEFNSTFPDGGGVPKEPNCQPSCQPTPPSCQPDSKPNCQPMDNVITGIAYEDANKFYNLTLNLTNVSIDKPLDRVISGTCYKFIVAPNEGYELPEYITFSENIKIHFYDKEKGKIKFVAPNGDSSITIEGVEYGQL